MREAFEKAGIQIKIEPGDVWIARDQSLKLLGWASRTKHETRPCLVLSNNLMCKDVAWPLVLVCPLTSELSPLAKTDLIIDRTDQNGLAVQSRLILSHIQPILKKDLKTKIGAVSHSNWEQIIKQIFWHIDRP